ncbi:DUF4912 domain-containing protein [Brachyspira hampsonii]|uniref:DUF4912 domain-containing protein n=1 Tax=Brachyspira hampsonii 30446 TaxID=1289135 RepID=A0A2U4FDX7_9SPIR|nr:DUF4912 domain-containing protein [Brachyspira hampsonii]EKV57764.1 hypothetical protein A966_04215 [Brachyspira hampsonii 30446]MBW5390586.1 DUF4912 domain-containing protein [Brachyspira hampsonii]MBW5393782.1 DUF4912 domain-containing protein [Brachyspira hampsonii]OEJ20702.1 DUF4912 domain-containing protein [Brachyspira hampsonii]
MATKKTEKTAEDTSKKTAAKKTTAKKTAEEKSESTPKKAAVKSAAAKKTTAKKTTSAKKASSKKDIEVLEAKEVKKDEYIPDEVDIVRELPERYKETKLVLMMRDPEWCFFYWDISDEDINYHSLKGKRISVRIFHVFGYDITNGEIHKEIEVNYIYGDRYVNLAMPHAYFIGELGYYDENNRFIVLARSNMIYAPRDSMSNVYDEEWMVNEEIIKLLKSPKALRESLSSATIFELIDLRRNHLAASSSSSLFMKKN